MLTKSGGPLRGFYRANFITIPIHLLPTHVDSFVRNVYKGGAIDVYIYVGENLRYHD